MPCWGKPKGFIRVYPPYPPHPRSIDSGLTLFHAPVHAAPAFAFHQVISNQFAPQAGGIFMVAAEDLVDLALAVAFARLEGLDDIAQHGLPPPSLRLGEVPKAEGAAHRAFRSG